MSNTKTISSLLNWAKTQLLDSSSPLVDARVLLCHCSGLTPTYLLTWPEKELDPTVYGSFVELIAKRKQGHPVAYLIGYRDFWTLRLKVSSNTLIPRPETELLVETSLRLDLPEQAKVLDLGTGTGAVALALAAERPNWAIFAVDSQPDAVKLAQQNAKDHQLTNVTIFQSNWFDSIEQQDFDLIVSNPPYVESDSIYLQRGDVRFEPLSALTSGKTGLDDIYRICNQAGPFLQQGSSLVFEHGHTQSKQVISILEAAGFSQCKTINDLSGLPRITSGVL